MNAQVQQVPEQDRSIKAYVSDAKIRQKFEEVLGKKTQGFLASVMQIANQPALKNAVPATVVNAAMMAATLDLPINNNLGFAYIVPYKRKYKDQSGKWIESNEAQFQMGYKGFIQLAQRSGQFSRLVATAVYQSQILSMDLLNGYEFDWTQKPQNGEKPVGYLAYFKLLNGFTAELYMTDEEVRAHAGRYSQSFKYGSGVWKDNFEAMALKTVIKLLLSKQAPLSIEMQTAQLADQAIVRDVATNDFDYIDHNESVGVIEAPKLTVSDDEFNSLLDQLNASAIDKDYILNGFELSESQRIAVEAQ